MKLLFKQKFFSWFDSFNVYDEYGNEYYNVEGHLAWGHAFHIIHDGNVVAILKEEVLHFLPHFAMYVNGENVGSIVKDVSLINPHFHFAGMDDISAEGNFMEWDYRIFRNGRLIATLSKELFRLTDTYTIDVFEEKDALICVMIALAIDAVKCNNSN